ncbi:spore germination protein [Paenibacillus polysaccharolyticus]|uniref:spore germination protein n=1 Tax=Paenibacillus polysaccharolyticus TaxID=582692 RepID=UPI00203FC00A|nr:spore germination protein [Paenibacillus polysaccharolyticus]MCM3131799.1 spore germination protein [Paenibacillus polysaccharolyticus]
MKENMLLQVQSRLIGVSDMMYQPLQIGPVSCNVLYIQSIIDNQVLREAIVKPLLEAAVRTEVDSDLIGQIVSGTFFSIENRLADTAELVVNDLVSGNVALWLEGMSSMLVFSIPSYQKRSVPESTNEVVVVGPQEAFIEDIQVNMSLLRHKIKHPDLKMIQFSIGKYTKTEVYVIYIQGLCKPDILENVLTSLGEINMDSSLGVSYLSEFLEDHPLSPFPQYQYTERPDSVAAALVEGRIAVMQDGTPFSLLIPVTFFSLMQSSEDYYQRFHSATFIRLIRLLFAIVAFLLPSAYVAVTTFHPEIIPTNLLITIASARENIPFPALVEALLMEITFEGLREAGIRIPKPLGQTVSIIGGIVVGQAAVQAGIVSAPLVIIVSITGIASFIIPHFELGLAFRLLRFPVLLMGGTLGLFGVVISVYLIYWYMVSLRSFGVPYMQPFAPFVLRDLKDTFIRVPWFGMKKRTQAYTPDNEPRQDTT